MNTNPKISILVANYNNARFLKEMYESVKQQSYTNWEILFVDDRSTDNSLEIIRQIQVNDPRIIVYASEKNGGIGVTRKKCMEISSGEIAVVLDPDDMLYSSEALRKVVNEHLANPDVVLMNSRMVECDEHSVMIGNSDQSIPQPEGKKFIETITVSHLISFKRDAYFKTEGFSELMLKGVDHDLFLKLEEVGPVKFLDEPLYIYRVHNRGISQGSNGLVAAQYSAFARCNAYKRRKNTTIPNLSNKEYQTINSNWHLREAARYRSKEKAKCNQILMKGLSSVPAIVFKKSFWSLLLRNNLG